jgi:hypothetical protein
MVGAPKRKVASMTDLLCACPGTPGHGGGRDARSPLGCGLEKRPPCPRLTEPAGDASPFSAGPVK